MRKDTGAAVGRRRTSNQFQNETEIDLALGLSRIMVKGRKRLVDIYRALFNSQQWDLSGPDCWLLTSFIRPDTHTYPEVWDFWLAVGRQRKVKFVWHNYKELRLFAAQQVPFIEAFASQLLRSASCTKRNKGLVVLYFCFPQVTKMPQRQSGSLLWPHQSWNYSDQREEQKCLQTQVFSL